MKMAPYWLAKPAATITDQPQTRSMTLPQRKALTLTSCLQEEVLKHHYKHSPAKG